MPDSAPERWRPVVGSEGRYEVSDHGRVRALMFRNRSACIPRVCLLSASGERYLRVSLYHKNAWVHLLVLKAFVGPRPEGYHAAHLDGDSKNNRLENLAWVPQSENERHKKTHGRVGRPTAKLTPADVREILAIGRSQPLNRTAARYGVTPDCIRLILRGETWTEITRA